MGRADELGSRLQMAAKNNWTWNELFTVGIDFLRECQRLESENAEVNEAYSKAVKFLDALRDENASLREQLKAGPRWKYPTIQSSGLRLPNGEQSKYVDGWVSGFTAAREIEGGVGSA